MNSSQERTEGWSTKGKDQNSTTWVQCEVFFLGTRWEIICRPVFFYSDSLVRGCISSFVRVFSVIQLGHKGIVQRWIVDGQVIGAGMLFRQAAQSTPVQSRSFRLRSSGTILVFVNRTSPCSESVLVGENPFSAWYSQDT